jgi:predicted RNA-binding protein YlqC (UPF0109 family)
LTSPADYEDGDVNVVADGYEEGDVNLVAGAGEDDDVNLAAEAGEDHDVNAIAEAGGTGREGRTRGGLPGAVLGYLARSLANEPAAVVVDVEERSGTVRLRLHVAQEDMGRVIGRRGRTAQAIRALVGVAGARDGVQTSVDIADD